MMIHETSVIRTLAGWEPKSGKHLRRMIREDGADVQASGSSEPALIVNCPNRRR
ncbi:MAG TPA: hypothetical protein VNG94_00225 [Pyrinomonadaceae bacterium]|nr:hypothetical protein [Pyrinomonadaceae bacterium]